MSQHLHSEFVEGCYRCDLSRDEMRGEECGFCEDGRIFTLEGDCACPYCHGTGVVQ